MANELSTASLEKEIGELSHALTNNDWDDDVKNSYYNFIEEEKRLVNEITWLVDKANKIKENVNAIDVGKFKSTYSQCESKLTRLSREG